MDQMQILVLIGVVLLGLIGYLHYIIWRQEKEIEQLWTQIAVLAMQTAKKIVEIQKEIKQEENGNK